MKHHKAHRRPAGQPPPALEEPASIPPGTTPGSGPGRIASLPRRVIDHKADKHVAPPMMKPLAFEASALQTAMRMVRWLYASILFLLDVVIDQMRGVDAPKQRAVRLRQTLERMGGTFIKLGQQMALRVDLLPVHYCDELSQLLDNVPPFPTEQAIARIEASIGRPVTEVFSVFDPVPIGSASISCVYQALLMNGEKVAIKVRRPRIGSLFAADLKAIDWLMGMLEFLTIIRPGLTKNLRFELRSMLMEELDFRREARYTDLFRRTAKEMKHRFITTPRVYAELSGEDVLVTEFVSGVWLWEVLNAVESGDPAALSRLKEQKISPRKVARRLIKSMYFGTYECVIFHADPHPANIIIGPGSKLTFIDFGSCGGYVERDRNLMRQIQFFNSRNDVEGMVQAAIALIEPLPPIDIDEFTRRVEMVWWQVLCAQRSKIYEWWEHTTAAIWLGLMQCTREYQIPLNLNTLRIMRSSLLYDTIAARLHKKIDLNDVYQSFEAHARRRDRKRALREEEDALLQLDPPRPHEVIKRVNEAGTRAMFQLQRTFPNRRGFSFLSLMSKSTYSWAVVMDLVFGCMLAASVAALVLSGLDYSRNQPIELYANLLHVVTSRWYFILVGMLFILAMRRIVMRLKDKEID